MYLSVVAPQAEDLGLLWANALLVGEELDVTAHQLADQRQGVADGDLVIRANVDNFADGRIATGQFKEAATGVQNIVEVACRCNVPELDLLLAVGDLRDDRRDHRPRRLARTIGVKRTCDRDGEIKSVKETHCHRVSAYLGRAVRRLRLQWVLLVDGYVLSGAIDLAGRGVDHAFHAVLHRRLADVECAFDIGVNVTVGCNVRVRDGDQCGQVKHDIDVFSNVFTIMGVTNISGKYLNIVFAIYIFQPSPIVKRVVLRKSFDFISLSHQNFSKMGTDKSIGTSDQNIRSLRHC